MDMVVGSGIEDDDELEEYMNEVDDVLMKETEKEMNLPEAPVFAVETKVEKKAEEPKKVEKRVAVMEE